MAVSGLATGGLLDANPGRQEGRLWLKEVLARWMVALCIFPCQMNRLFLVGDTAPLYQCR